MDPGLRRDDGRRDDGRTVVPAQSRAGAPLSGDLARIGARAEAPLSPRTPGDKPIASPAVRRRAWDLGIELQFVTGSGPGGRIMHEDLEAFAARGAPHAGGASSGTRYVERHDEEAIPVIGLRRRIAQKMQEAKRRIPHFTYVEEVDVTELEALRAKVAAEYRKTSLHESGSASSLGYAHFPVRLFCAMRHLIAGCIAALPRVTCPVLLVQAENDDMTSPRNSQFIYDHVGSKRREIVLLKESYHVVTADLERTKVATELQRFCESVSAKRAAPAEAETADA